jgi:hypothetical protein
MAKGIKKLEDDVKEGRAYSSGMHMHGENEVEGEEGESRPRKRARTVNNNPLTRTSSDGCKCGAMDHKCTSSSKCPWKGMPRKEVAAKYALRRNKSVREEAAEKAANPTGKPGTREAVDPTEDNFEVPVDGVQSTSKLFGTRAFRHRST